MHNERLARAKLLQIFDLRMFSHPCAVTLTMKKASQGETNDGITASTNFRHFSNRLNAAVLGSKAKRHGGRLTTLAVIECNADDRLHYHAIIDRPARWSFEEFAALVRCKWEQTKFGYQQIDVQDAANAGWIDYMLKFRQKDSLLDSIDWNNCHLDC